MQKELYEHWLGYVLVLSLPVCPRAVAPCVGCGGEGELRGPEGHLEYPKPFQVYATYLNMLFISL